MIRATLRTITARRGSFRGGALVVLVGVLLVIGVLVVVHELRPGRNPSVGGQPLLDGVGGAVWALGTVVAILIGALAGSYDVAQGTMRYLVLTGVGRLRIYLARTVAVVGAVLLALVPALGLGLIAVFVLPSTDADRVTAGEVRGRRVDVRPLPSRLRADRDGHRHPPPLERPRDRGLAALRLRGGAAPRAHRGCERDDRRPDAAPGARPAHRRGDVPPDRGRRRSRPWPG